MDSHPSHRGDRLSKPPMRGCRAIGGFEPFCPGFELLIESAECNDLAGAKGDMDGLLAAGARLQELDGDDSRLGGDGDQFDEPVGGADLAVFEPEALRLKDA